MVAKVYFPNFHSTNIAEIKNRLAKRATDLSAAGFKPTYSDKECWIGRVAFYKEDESIPMEADGTPMLPLLQLSLEGLPYIPDGLENTKMITVFISEDLPTGRAPSANGPEHLPAGLSANGHGWTFANNYIGVASDGVTTSPILTNSGHGISVSSSRVYSQETSSFLLNLYNSFPVQPLSTADIANFAAQLTTILANAQLGPVLITGNVISGNTQNGVEIFSENIAGVFVTLNMIGTDVTGNIAVGNGQSGVHFVGSPFANVIGPENVISGNAAYGIDMAAGKVALPNFIMGNRIGLSATNPGAAVGNGLSGITTNAAAFTSPRLTTCTQCTFVRLGNAGCFSSGGPIRAKSRLFTSGV